MAINSIRPYLEITVQYMSFVTFINLSMAINFIYGTFSRKTQLVRKGFRTANTYLHYHQYSRRKVNFLNKK